MEKDIYMSTHIGHVCGEKIYNSYRIFKQLDDHLYIKMSADKYGHEVFILFDEEDLNKLKGIIWYITMDGYVQGRMGDKNVHIHRVIMDFKGTVYHINKDKLDNRKSNLKQLSFSYRQKWLFLFF